MKKTSTLFVTVLIALCLLLLGGCTKQSLKKLRVYDNLSESMQLYYQVDLENNEGEYFEAKIERAVYVENSDYCYFVNCYTVYLAPTTDLPIDIKSIEVKVNDDKVHSYLINSNRGLNQFNTMILDEEHSYLFPKMKRVEEFKAFSFNFKIYDCGLNDLENNGITTEELNAALDNVSIIVNFNNATEELIITHMPVVILEDNQHYQNPYYQKIVETTSCGSYFTYVNKDYCFN